MFQEVVNDFIVPVGLYIMLLRIIEWASKIGKDFHCNPAPSLRPAALGAILYSVSLLGLLLCESPSCVFIQRLLALL